MFGNLNFNSNQTGQTTTTIRDGVLIVADPVGSLNVGRSFGAGASATVQLGGLSQLSATVHEFHVGTTSGGSASGNITLAADNVVVADEIVIGENAGAHLQLGQTNEFVTADLHVAKDHSNATVEIVNGGGLEVGNNERRALWTIADQNFNGRNQTKQGRVDLSGGRLDAFLDGLIVARKSGGDGTTVGELIGGTGQVDIGAVGNTANVIIGQTMAGGTASGLVDFGGMQGLTANLNELIVGQGASGSLFLTANNTIDARSIFVGRGGTGQLRLGQLNTITARELAIANDHSNATVEIISGGSLNLGTAEQRTLLSVADQNWDGPNQTKKGRVDLTGSSLNAFLDGLIVGRKTGGDGTTIGELVGGTGHVDIGAEGNTANVIIGQTTVGGTATGSVNLSGMQSLTANLNQLLVGQGAVGTFALPAHNTIDARSIIIGQGASGVVTLGQTNTIVADTVLVGRSLARGRIDVPAGATLNLGTPDRRTNLTLGLLEGGTDVSMSGEIDLTSATLVAYLGEVVIGERHGTGRGVGTGVLRIGSAIDNDIDAETITLAVDQGHGTLAFGGGQLSVGTIVRGTGVANFDWQGGTLSVDAFGSAGRSFDLRNLGSGVLSPGESAGGTNVWGEYRQGPAATYQADLGGLVPFAQHDQVQVAEVAVVDGILDTRLYNGFAPSTNDTFTILTAGSLTGQFTNAPRGVSTLLTPFGSYDVAYTATDVILSNFIPDPLAPAASIGALNSHMDDVLGGSALLGGVDAAFEHQERGILHGRFDKYVGLQLSNLINGGTVDFDAPSFDLPAEQLQVWGLDFEGDPIGSSGVSLAFGYDDAGLVALEEMALDIFQFEDGAWVALGGTIDTVDNTISVVAPSLSSFGVGLRFGPELGDFDGSNSVDANDIDLLAAAIRAGSTDLMFDLDGSGGVDSDDITNLIETLLQTEFGDANLDLAVTASGDGATLLSNLGSDGPHGWADANFSVHLDTLVTASDDGALLLENLSNDAATVPEPRASVQLGIVCLLIGLWQLLRGACRGLNAESSDVLYWAELSVTRGH